MSGFQRALRHTLPSRTAGRPDDDAWHWNELAGGFAERGRYEHAVECYDRALAIGRDIAEIWNSRGKALQNLDRLDEAEASFREAARLEPDAAGTHNDLGTVLDYLGRFDEAEAGVRTALRLQPDFARAHFNLGVILYHLCRTDEAEASFRAALRHRPDHPEWHVALSFALLLAGKYAAGWQEFEWRWRTKVGIARGQRLPVPLWNGEAVGDRVLLLHADQGFGDTIQFCRYVPQIAAGARTVLEVQPALVRLLSRLPGVADVIARDDELPSFDLHRAIMSLPFAAGTTLENIPAATPYLTADPADVAHWRERLAGLAGLRVGLCWAGDGARNLGNNIRDRRRSTTLESLAPLGEIPGVSFVSLQKGPPAAQAECPPPGMALHDFTGDLHDFADTAALIENLDLVISVCTSVTHLAGALGKPVWLLNHFDTCWRWLLNREDSPWYPTLRQFRQPAPGDWSSVVGQAQGALQRLAAGDRSQLGPPPERRPAGSNHLQPGCD